MVTKEIVKRHWYNEKKVVITCDICGRDYTSNVDIKRCMVCGKDVCLGCAISLSTPSKWWHKRSSWFCNVCWKAGKDRRAVMDSAEESFELLIEKELATWRRDVGCDKDV